MYGGVIGGISALSLLKYYMLLNNNNIVCA